MKTVRSLLMPLVAVSATMLALYIWQRPSPPADSSFEQVRQEAESGGYRLISTEKLWERLRAEPGKTLLVDTRQEWEFRTGHIQGALNFPMEPTWWARWRERGPLEKFLGSDKDRSIVFY